MKSFLILSLVVITATTGLKAADIFRLQDADIKNGINYNQKAAKNFIDLEVATQVLQQNNIAPRTYQQGRDTYFVLDNVVLDTKDIEINDYDYTAVGLYQNRKLYLPVNMQTETNGRVFLQNVEGGEPMPASKNILVRLPANNSPQNVANKYPVKFISKLQDRFIFEINKGFNIIDTIENMKKDDSIGSASLFIFKGKLSLK